MTKIHINSFVRRQTAKSGFSHWELTDAELLARIERNFDKANKGYKDGVILVPVEPDGFYSAIVQLQPGDISVGQYIARKANEEPRKSSYSLAGNKMPAKRVDIVLYRHDVLAENNEHETDAEWEIVSVNAAPTEDETPISTGTLIANHLQLSGGTATNMTDTEFVALLRKSVDFWKDKSNVAPEHLRDVQAGLQAAAATVRELETKVKELEARLLEVANGISVPKVAGTDTYAPDAPYWYIDRAVALKAKNQ